MREHSTTATDPGRRRFLELLTAAVAFGGPAVRGAAVANADPPEQLVPLPDGHIHVVTDGPPGAPAIVLLHGLAGSTAWWDPVVPALADHHVVRIDLLGHGRSDKPDTGYGIPEQAGRVAAVLDRLGVPRAVIVGHSTGGYVATALAEQRPDLVTAIGVIDTGPRLDAFTDNGPVGDLLFIPAIGRPLWPLLPDAAIRASLGSAFTPGVPIPDRLVADVRGMTYRSLTATSTASDVYLRERPEPDRLTDLALPALLLYGTCDQRWQPASFAEYGRVPGIRIETLDCGHTPMIEEPGPTGALLRDFAENH
ncbi:alpha/beta fold hydrolase [Nocardia aurantia]|uniref:2-succinyl-6-hydroxy-2, 4-cyclohexadiene-1-carboxylate synthase n=1 Tax=Nocardia aurantia TaxID=2585199 RepID=A0A7K0DZZ9_9NOCA|nr:alpha/beta hydrolase [Nocardia aurantia]MQY31305.1 2-succinyl-6-hydroxy-2,4-cyclohexadiene-1-carboxylate synthase [Nocardia aurantia]